MSSQNLPEFPSSSSFSSSVNEDHIHMRLYYIGTLKKRLVERKEKLEKMTSDDSKVKNRLGRETTKTDTALQIIAHHEFFAAEICNIDISISERKEFYVDINQNAEILMRFLKLLDPLLQVTAEDDLSGHSASCDECIKRIQEIAECNEPDRIVLRFNLGNFGSMSILEKIRARASRLRKELKQRVEENPYRIQFTDKEFLYNYQSDIGKDKISNFNFSYSRLEIAGYSQEEISERKRVHNKVNKMMNYKNNKELKQHVKLPLALRAYLSLAVQAIQDSEEKEILESIVEEINGLRKQSD